MRPERNFKQKVRIRSYQEGATDKYNDATDDHGDPVEKRARLEQTDAREITVGRSTQISDWLLMIVKSAVIGANDLVLDEDDRVFEVIGAPSKERDVGGRITHVEANLRLIEG